MKQIALTFVAFLILTSSASAGGITFNLPNLDFPTQETVTVGKACTLADAAAGLCSAER